MQHLTKYRLLNFFIATVWFANGFFCKLLNLVPRHQQIVARIAGADHAALLTRVIGIAEMIMAAWIFSGIAPRFNALAQLIIIAAMNTLEFFLAPDLLLWGRWNSLFAFLFILLICYNERNRTRSTHLA